MSKYADLITRRQIQYGSKFNASSLAPQFEGFYNSGARIEVDFGYEVKRGRIGVTTGWNPCFILMLRRSDHGSSYTLGTADKVLKIIAV